MNENPYKSPPTKPKLLWQPFRWLAGIRWYEWATIAIVAGMLWALSQPAVVSRGRPRSRPLPTTQDDSSSTDDPNIDLPNP
jgi:hypothetical protein